MIIINLKTYKTLEKDLKLAKSIEEASKKIMIAVQPTDIYLLAKSVKNPILAQHIDPVEPGRNTGFITAKSIKEAGAVGTFLNHSEHRLKLKVIKETISICKRLSLKSIVFTTNIKEGRAIARFKPNYIVIEPKELVAGKVSISKAKPGLIKDAVDKIKGNILVGAGIKTFEDVKIAKKLGARGIVASHNIIKAKNPSKLLKTWIKIFQ